MVFCSLDNDESCRCGNCDSVSAEYIVLYVHIILHICT